MFLGSEALALASLTERVTYLEEGDWVEVGRDTVLIHESAGQIIERPIQVISPGNADIGRGNYQHFMLKEIYEQPAVIGDCLHSLFNPLERTISLPDISIDLSKVNRLNIVDCGTSYYEGLVARYWFEEIEG